MTEKQGFTNAPTVTEFAVGMVVSRPDGTLLGKVVEANERGAYLFHAPDPHQLYFLAAFTAALRLDLSPERMWVGREYRAKESPMRRVRILAPPEFTKHGQVHFVNHNAEFCCWSVADFLAAYEPLPLESVEPKVEMPDDAKMNEHMKQTLKMLTEIFDYRYKEHCWFDGDADCVPWATCPKEHPACPLVILAGLCGYRMDYPAKQKEGE